MKVYTDKKNVMPVNVMFCKCKFVQLFNDLSYPCLLKSTYMR